MTYDSMCLSACDDNVDVWALFDHAIMSRRPQCPFRSVLSPRARCKTGQGKRIAWLEALYHRRVRLPVALSPNTGRLIEDRLAMSLLVNSREVVQRPSGLEL